MADRKTLRAYQSAAVNAALTSIQAGRRDLIVMPPGSGKSVVIASVIDALRPSNRRRILVLSHVQEILGQDLAAIEAQVTDATIGVACHGMGRFEYGRNVTIASIQTMRSKLDVHRWNYSAVLVDEAHLIGRREESVYQRVFARLDGIPIIGFTATPYRLDSGYLHRGDGALFKRIAYEVPITPLVQAEVLAPLISPPVSGVDFSALRRKRGGDFDVAEYTKGDDKKWLAETTNCIQQATRLAADRKKILIFACTVRHAEAIVGLLRAAGIASDYVAHGTPRARRREAVAAFACGELRALVNVNILTVGFDAPDIDCIVQLRPTCSTVLHCQSLGRGLRKAPGKLDCLVLDYAGNIGRHGPLTEIEPQRTDKGGTKREDAERGQKRCPGCDTPYELTRRQCVMCGHLFSSFGTEQLSHTNALMPEDAPLQGERLAYAPDRRPPTAPAPDAIDLCGEEVAWLLGTTVQYVRQMRSKGMGPPYTTTGAQTSLGWRAVTYKRHELAEWMRTVEVFAGKEGKNGRRRVWRFTPKGMQSLRDANEKRKNPAVG